MSAVAPLSERLFFNQTGAIATIEALYHINGKALQFTPPNYVTFDTQKGTAVIKGFVTDGLLKGARVNGEFQAISPCGITNALAGAFGKSVQGNLVIRPGSKDYLQTTRNLTAHFLVLTGRRPDRY